MRQPQIAWLAGGRRLHLQDGPIDLIIEAEGDTDQRLMAFGAACRRMTGLLDELCEELPLLRAQTRSSHCALQGVVARKMHAAVVPFLHDGFITPMAAVAGAVAQEVLGAMTVAADLDRAYVNNGGDIAIHLAEGQRFAVGLIDRPDRPSLIGKTLIHAGDATRGIATSGRHGRSFSLGIADAVTVLADTAAQADAAATIIANAIDLPGHPAIHRAPACDIQPDNDLGSRLVTRDVGDLDAEDVTDALSQGADRARMLLGRGLINGAALSLKGETAVVALAQLEQPAIPAHHLKKCPPIVEDAFYA